MQVALDLLSLRPILLDSCGVEVSLPAGVNTVIDTIPLSNFKKLQYALIFTSADLTKRLSAYIDLIKIGSDVTSVAYDIAGSRVLLDFSTEISGLNLLLKINNREAFTVTCNFTKTIN